jgi:predicted SAM-dependent methyltransferase
MRRIIAAIFRICGYEIKRLPRKRGETVIPAVDFGEKIVGKKVYVGCGPDYKEGYIGCDIRKTSTVSIQCKAWEISRYCDSLEEIFSRHMLEHLTIKELEVCLKDWHKALSPGGYATIIVPNMEFHIEQWRNAEWNDRSIMEPKSDARWSMAGFWGWQKECDPTMTDYNSIYWDVHKSGYNEASLRYFLQSAGFRCVKTEVVEECHLHAIATK